MAVGDDAEPAKLHVVLAEPELWPAVLFALRRVGVFHHHDGDMMQLVIEQRPLLLLARGLGPPVVIERDLRVAPAKRPVLEPELARDAKAFDSVLFQRVVYRVVVFVQVANRKDKINFDTRIEQRFVRLVFAEQFGCEAGWSMSSRGASSLPA